MPDLDLALGEVADTIRDGTNEIHRLLDPGAPFPGIVADLTATPGAQVSEDTTLARIEKHA